MEGVSPGREGDREVRAGRPGSEMEQAGTR